MLNIQENMYINATFRLQAKVVKLYFFFFSFFLILTQISFFLNSYVEILASFKSLIHHCSELLGVIPKMSSVVLL